MSHAMIAPRYYEFAVPGDGSCFFYSLGLAYLLPKIADAVEFAAACDLLFRRENPRDFDRFDSEAIRQILLKYAFIDELGGSSNFLNTNRSDPVVRDLNRLLNDTFRNKIIDQQGKLYKASEFAYNKTCDACKLYKLDKQTALITVNPASTSFISRGRSIVDHHGSYLFVNNSEDANNFQLYYISKGGRKEEIFIREDKKAETQAYLSMQLASKPFASELLTVADSIEFLPRDIYTKIIENAASCPRYAEEMRIPGEWAADSQVESAAALLNRNVRTYFLSGGKKDSGMEDDAFPPLCVTLDNRNPSASHYNSMLSHEDAAKVTSARVSAGFDKASASSAVRGVEGSAVAAGGAGGDSAITTVEVSGGAGAGTTSTASNAGVFSEMTIGNPNLMTALAIGAKSYKEEGGLARNNASLATALGIPLSAGDPKECLKGLKTALIQRLEGIANSENLDLKGVLNNLVKDLNPREDSEVGKPRSLLARITATKTGFRTPSLELRVGRDAQSFSVRMGAIQRKLSSEFSPAAPKP